MLSSRNSLLKVLSSEGVVSWQRYRQCVDVLSSQFAPDSLTGTGKASLFNWRLARALDCLGHCEIARTSRDLIIRTVRPGLALLPRSGILTTVLTGARSESLMECLEERATLSGNVHIDIREQISELYLSPSRITLSSHRMAEIQAIAEECGLVGCGGPAAAVLAAVSGSLNDYLCESSWQPHRMMNWRFQEFSLCELRFVDHAEAVGNVRLLKYIEPTSGRPLYVMVRGEEESEVIPEWGRYAVLSIYRHDVLVYDKRTFQLAVPVTLPLPKLIARSLGLCSGFSAIQRSASCVTPCMGQTAHVNLYLSIPPNIAADISKKLGQQLIDGTIVPVNGCDE